LPVGREKKGEKTHGRGGDVEDRRGGRRIDWGGLRGGRLKRKDRKRRKGRQLSFVWEQIHDLKSGDENQTNQTGGGDCQGGLLYGKEGERSLIGGRGCAQRGIKGIYGG